VPHAGKSEGLAFAGDGGKENKTPSDSNDISNAIVTTLKFKLMRFIF